MRTSSGITAYVPRAYQNLAVSLPREYRARVLCKPISSSRAARDSILRSRCVRVRVSVSAHVREYVCVCVRSRICMCVRVCVSLCFSHWVYAGGCARALVRAHIQI